MVRCAVVAGSEAQAEAYASGRRLTDWFYVADATMLRDRGSLRVEYTGTWQGRPDRQQIAIEADLLLQRGESL